MRTKTTDVFISIAFLLFFGYYLLMGLVFSGMGGSDPSLFLLATFVGLVLITISLFSKILWKYAVTRIMGLLLSLSIIYYDVFNNFAYESRGEFAFYLVLNLPLWFWGLYLIYSVVMLIYLAANNKFFGKTN